MAQLVAAECVRAFMARTWLARAADVVRVGGFTLRPSQCEAVRAIEEAFGTFGGALLADPPGTGKTVIALAVQRDAPRTVVVAPATLRAQWRHAASQAERTVEFVSFESLSRGSAVPPAPPASLVVVDEAHHARTPTTLRYGRLAALCAGARVLLLSATPVVNRGADLHALLGLFLGARAEHLDAESLARVVVRREVGAGPRPTVRALSPLHTASGIPALDDAIRSLPIPLPAADGVAALALIQMSLAMAWGSSLAALDAALRRRIQRAAALGDALVEGRWPDRRGLAQWLIGDDATQLTMPLLLPDISGPPPADAINVLARHVDAVRGLRELVRPAVERDSAARANELRALLRAHPGVRVVVFARHAETIRALWRALRSDPGVVAITGTRIHAASGRWSREEILSALGPRARPYRDNDVRAIRLLLTTDLLAEGVELQGVGIVVHGDAVWNPARSEQRLGRVTRVGGASEVYETHFAIPAGAEALVRLEQRLARKEGSRQRAVQDARARELLVQRLSGWAEQEPDAPCRIGCAVSSTPGFLALVRLGSRVELVGAQRRRGRWRVSANPEQLRHRAALAEGASREPPPGRVNAARRILATWCASRAARDIVGALSGDAPLARAARRRLDAVLTRTPLATRTARAAATAEALAVLTDSPGVGAVRALRALLRAHANDTEFAEGLLALARTLRGQRANRSASPLDSPIDPPLDSPIDPPIDPPAKPLIAPPGAPTRDRPRLVALLLLEPSATAFAFPSAQSPAPTRLRARAATSPPPFPARPTVGPESAATH